MSAVVQIFIMKGGALEGTEMVSGDRFVIGSDGNAAVVLDDPSVGARHVGVFVHEGKLAIQDLGAPGGTLVNGAPIQGARYLNPREDVVVGVYTLKLKLMPARGAATAPPSAVPSGPVAVAPSAAPASPAPAPSPPAPSPPAPSPPPAPVVSARPASPSPVAAPTPMAASSAPRPGIQVGHGLDELEKTVPGPPPSTDPPPIGSDDRTVVDTAPGAPAAPALHLAILDDEEAHDDDEPWSLVERLVRPPEHAAGKHPVVEIVHYRGEHVVDHRVLREGERFLLGDTWTKAQRVDRGLTKPLPLVHLKKDGVAEILQHDGVTGRVLRQGVQTELPAGGAPAPLVDGELCSLKIGAERIFVRFAGVPALLWTPEQLQEARAERRLTALSGFFAVAFLAFLVGMSWLYGFRSKNEDVIELGDDGFAEVVIKDLEFKEPEPEKKKEPPPPVKAPEPTPTPPEPTSKTPPTPTPKEQPKAAPADAAPSEAPKTTGLAAALSNIPKVNDSASSQNLNAALSNIKGVRVPGAQGGFKTSALTGKGPSSGVQIGGAAGGVATSGINSLIRKDGAAGSLGGKGDRAVAGKVTTQPRLSQMKGTGELSKDEIQRVINSHVGEIQYCYEKQLRGNAGLAGRVVLEWTVTSSGSVSVVKVATSSLSSADATNCMMDRVKKWKFPKPRGSGNVTVVYPFVFNTI
jgi:TonB family protein